MKTLTRIVGAVLLVLTCSSAYAQYPVNPTYPEETDSTGQSQILMTIPKLYMISGVSNVNFGTLNDGQAIITGVDSILTSGDTFCVYTNQDDHQYRVDLTGDGTGSTFQIEGAEAHNAAEVIQYRVYWDDDTTAAGHGIVGSKGGTTDFANNQQGSNQYDCGGSDNARFDIEFDRDDILDVMYGSYEGVLTIVISEPT